MTIVILILLFVAAVAGLSLTRKLVVFELTAVSLLTTGSRRPGLTLYAVLTFPGTILHELSHWLMAEILRVPTGAIRLLPESETESGENRLGSVMTASADPVRGFLIGLAPFLTGILALIILNTLLVDFWGVAPWWQSLLLVYGLIVVGNSMLISSSDRRYWPIMAILLVLGAVVIYSLEITISSASQAWMQINLKQLDLVLGLAVALNLILLTVLFGVRYMVEKITGKKVVTTRSKL